jgi:hypothetical protein
MHTSDTDVMRFTHFSQHANKRVLQRTRLSTQYLARVLDHRLVVNTGTEPGLPREHLLFYSTPDECCFVAVRDTMTGKVVTVLPLEYHQNLAWAVSPAQVKMAKDLASAIVPEVPSVAVEPIVPSVPCMLVVSCSYAGESGNSLFKVLVRVNASPYRSDIKTFVCCSKTPALLDTAAVSKGINPKRILSLSVRLGNKGIPKTWVFHQNASQIMQ